MKGKPQTSDEVGDENHPLPFLGEGMARPGSGARQATSAGMYPAARSSWMVSSMTLDATHLPFSSASAIAGEKCGHGERLEAKEQIWALEL